MEISEACIRRPVMTTLITASLIVFGIFAYRLLAVAALPAVDFPTIQITATLPGASPETMAASVAGPIERQLSTIAGITSMTSTSALGTSSIIIQFDLNRNIDGAALDVQTALTVAARRLPVEMTTPPFFRKVNPGDFADPLHQPGLVDPAAVDGRRLRRDHAGAADFAAARRRAGPGLRRAEIRRAGPGRSGRGRRARHLARRRPQRASPRPIPTRRSAPSRASRQNTTLLATAAMRKAADYRNVVVAYRNGAPVKLDEIANVIDSVENDKIASWFNDERADRAGDPAPARRQHGRGRRHGASERLPTYRAQIPAAIKMEVLNDRSISIRDSVARRAGHAGDRRSGWSSW